LLLDLIAAAIFRFVPASGELLARLSARAADRSGRYCAGLVALSALAYIPMANVFRPWQWIQYGPFALQPSFTLHYVIYFFAGVGIGAYGIERGLLGSQSMLVRRWPAWMAVGFGAFVLWIVPTALITQGWDAPGLEVAGDLGLVLACAAMSFALAAVFIRFASVRSQAADSLAENAYSIYLLHYIFVIWLQYILLGFALFAVVKAAIVFAGTLALSWGLSAAICRVRVGALVLGRERALVRAR
jgi:glucan biosynthesis protein C